ncbi:MAG: hypothetical protein COB04_09395 [Gammaproteobacteria bacterium]|nr:MAG: hypothetical protein COB04_09395 [Gammaproteobacteria bacterium]
MIKLKSGALAMGLLALSAFNVSNAAEINNGRALATHTNQNEIKDLSLTELRKRGLLVFTTPFNTADGFGDGPIGETPAERSTIGGRPGLQGNNTFSRVNGLDAQSCLECHAVLSRNTIPMTFGIGGTGGINDTVIAGATFVNANHDADQINSDGPTTGKNNINGRAINPPFVFGSGGVELVGNEMTADLQAKLVRLQARGPGSSIALTTKGISFGELRLTETGELDASDVTGIDNDVESETFLVVQPFGRKGNNITTRRFNQDATRFHFGMTPDEVLYEQQNGFFPDPSLDGQISIDGDNDGVINEFLIGDLSVLNIFSATLDKPRENGRTDASRRGLQKFKDVGCADCHTPVLKTTTKTIGLRYPEVPQNPSENVYLSIDLTEKPGFRSNREGGINVRLFADLKIHNMGPELAEANGDANFTTARLWGVADTAPYLHDGRALTIEEAIFMHGQEGSDAEEAVTSFGELSEAEQSDVYALFSTLKTPRKPARDLLNNR